MGIKVEKLAKEMNLEVVISGNKDNEISVSDTSRPGLQFTGYYDYFANSRLQILGLVEMSYLDTLSSEVRAERFKQFFEFDIPCVIITRGLEPHKELLQEAKKHNVWVLKSQKITTRLISKIMNYIDRELAESTSVHGVLMNVYGVGILITGRSGIGKSETALELIKRGHMLVTDDVVEIKNIDGVLHGTSPYITSGMLEVRGMGIMDIASLYGLSSILEEKTIDFIIEIEEWSSEKNYDRLGAANDKREILNVPVDMIKLPIMPGRNVAVIIEAAAANYRYSNTSKVTPLEKVEKRMNEVMNINK
jgi:HPr kinase/phosphorylase